MDERERMIYEIKKRYKLDDPRVFSAMLQVPREKFAPPKHIDIAYDDAPVPIGYGQTMSQPYTVAFMTSLLNLKGNEKVLEIGTGSGYQAAVLSKLARRVYTIEIIPNLAKRAERILRQLGYKNVSVKIGSGKWGWEEKAPFDAIIVTAGIREKVPKALFEQLKQGGILVAPIGRGEDKVMTRFIKGKDKILKEEYGIFHFVPFIEEKN